MNNTSPATDSPAASQGSRQANRRRLLVGGVKSAPVLLTAVGFSSLAHGNTGNGTTKCGSLTGSNTNQQSKDNCTPQ